LGTGLRRYDRISPKKVKLQHWRDVSGLFGLEGAPMLEFEN
jgi:hypothetical protein